MLAAMRPLKGNRWPECRETPIDQVHMTLLFIGDTAARELDEVTESVSRSVAGLGPFVLQPTRVIMLPDEGWPRLVAMETDAPGVLLEAHRRLAVRLARSPRAKAGDRFLPHFTLCRFANDARVARLEERMYLPPFPVERIALMSSALRPGGAEHAEVASLRL